MQHCFVHDGKGGNNVKTRAERNEIYYNWIEGALYHELELIGPDGQDPSLAREDSDVVGNVFRKTGTSFVTRIGGDGTGDTSGRYRFVNNTFVLAAGSASAFRLFDQVESVEMHNNVFLRAGGGGVKVIQDADVSWVTGSAIVGGSNNWVPMGSETVPASWANTIVGNDPGVEAGGFGPSAASPLVDAGVGATTSPPGYAFPSPLAMPAFLPPSGAIEGLGAAVPRPVVGTIDVGAYEFGVDPSGSSGAGGSGTSGDSSGAGASGQTSGAGVPTGSGGSNGSGATGNGDDFLSDEDTDANAPLEPTGCGCRTSPTGPALPAALGAALALVVAAARRRRRS
jgi:MYXO-CTERM domain-containing protein